MNDHEEAQSSIEVSLHIITIYVFMSFVIIIAPRTTIPANRHKATKVPINQKRAGATLTTTIPIAHQLQARDSSRAKRWEAIRV